MRINGDERLEAVVRYLKDYFDWFYFPRPSITDIVEIIILAVAIYYIIGWFQTTRAWTLVKGIVVLLLFMAVASLLQFNTLIWIFKHTISVGVIAVIIIFQPEFRKVLESIGRKRFLASLFSSDEEKTNHRMDKRMLNEIARATYAMSEVKTGALIVIEQDVQLGDYERTGIALDSIVSSQLLINIFEHNTPLHDGAVLIRNDRIVSATCYLPLSDNPNINKALGTRHRAGIGVSEVSDSITIIVSEETGAVSIAHNGEIIRKVSREQFVSKIEELGTKETIKSKVKKLKGFDRK